MSISSPGDVEITGKINHGKCKMECHTKVSGLVNAGTFLTLDNLKVSVTTGGSRGLLSLQLQVVLFVIFQVGMLTEVVVAVLLKMSPIQPRLVVRYLGGGFCRAAGNTAQYHIIDLTNNRFYRVTMMIGSSYINNFMSIERLY